jgi:hypothetical protein
MAITHKFYIGYWDKKYLDYQFPDRINTPYFQICEGEADKSPIISKTISRSGDFPALALSLVQYLNEPESILKTHEIEFSQEASPRLGKTKKQVLEEIVILHNRVIA